MDDAIYKITLSDGTVLENLHLNGNNFISENAVTEDMFVGNCCHMIIDNGEQDTVFENMELIHITVVDGKYWFAFRELTSEEIASIKMQSDIEYLAMMTGIEL